MPNQTNVNNGLATLTVHETLQPGTYTITGHYNGSDNYQESEGEAELEVLKKSTTTTLSSSKASYSTSEDIIFTIEVKDSNNASITTGSYILYEDNTQIQAGLINGNSVAVNIGKKSASVKNYKVVYQENATYVGSTSNTVEITVSKADTSIRVEGINLYLEGDSVCYYVIEDDTNFPVLQGKCAVKISGKTVKNSGGKVIYSTPNEDGIHEFIFPKQANWNVNSSYPVQITFPATSDYNSSNITVNVTPAEYPPIITDFTSLSALSLKEEGKILFDLEVETDATNEFLLMNKYMDNYLYDNPLILLIATENELIGYVIGVDPVNDTTLIQGLINSGEYDRLYIISNFENADGTIEYIGFDNKSGDGAVIGADMNIDSDCIPDYEDIRAYILLTHDSSLSVGMSVYEEEGE